MSEQVRRLAPVVREAATRRGGHGLLAALPRQVAPSDFRANRTLALRVELERQLRRRRTQLAALVVLVLPVVVAIVLRFNPPEPSTGGTAATGLLDLSTAGASNYALLIESVSLNFLLVVLVALFCGDTVASEASWSSLRYLLVIPVPRARLLRQKLVVALGLSTAVNVALPAWSFIVGGVAFGWAPLVSPLGGTFTAGQSVGRIAVVVGYVIVQLLFVAALAFLLGVLTDAPLGAVGGATMLVIVSNIFDSFSSFDPYRQVLPTHFQYSWLDALAPAISWNSMMQGAGLVLIYVAALLGTAWWRFERKDILS